MPGSRWSTRSSYDINTVDFAPIFAKAQESGADFIYLIASVNAQVVSSQYVKLQVPMGMTGVNVAALGQEYWEDTGGAGGGISTLSPVPSVGFELDPVSQSLRRHLPGQVRHAPQVPAFQWLQRLSRAEAGRRSGRSRRRLGGEPLGRQDAGKQDLVLEHKGGMWLRYAFWKPDEVEERTQPDLSAQCPLRHHGAL